MLEILQLLLSLCLEIVAPRKEGMIFIKYLLAHSHSCPPHSLTVSQVNSYLDDLAMCNVKRDRPGVKKALQLLLRNTSAIEQKWLIRMILRVSFILTFLSVSHLKVL